MRSVCYIRTAKPSGSLAHSLGAPYCHVRRATALIHHGKETKGLNSVFSLSYLPNPESRSSEIHSDFNMQSHLVI